MSTVQSVFSLTVGPHVTAPICRWESLAASMERPASHAGSWYSASKKTLTSQIAQWLNSAHVTIHGRFGVGPHAGWTYCGATLAHAYKGLNPSTKRVFLMGPSHYLYFKGVQVSKFSVFDTPLGPVDVDTKVTKALHKAGLGYLDADADEEEHALEMHVPMLKYVAPEASIVPLLFGDVSSQDEQQLIELLTPYFNDPDTAFMVSSDFCHWGSRFKYTKYAPDFESLEENIQAGKLVPVSRQELGQPIWQSIQDLDHLGMEIAARGDAKDWKEYIRVTGNTICGQRPLGFILALANANNKKLELNWLDYAQSSKVKRPDDSSVSYAAAIST